MKRPPPKGSARALISYRVPGQNTDNHDARLADQAARRQDQTHRNGDALRDGVHLAALWRAPRDRSRAIQFTLREFNGVEFLDIRQYNNSSGFMVPTKRGVTISIAQLGRFAEAAGAAYRKAVAMGLVRPSS